MAFAYTVALDDPTGAVGGVTATALLDNLKGALDIYSRHFVGQGVIDVSLKIDTLGASVGTGRSLTSVFKETLAGGKNVYHQGATSELITGADPNGITADIEITLPPAYLANTLWLDPNPYVRGTPMAAGKFDAVSFFLHELGHGFGFNGWGDPNSGANAGPSLSVYDTFVVNQGGVAVFTGPLTQAAYGGPLPLSDGTFNTYTHYGHLSADGLDLSLMEGSTYSPAGVRWYLDTLDLALFRDLGITALSSPVADAGGSRFQGFAGNDQLVGANGADTLLGGGGLDFMRGGGGDDSMAGGAGFDDMHGNQGDDTLYGHEGDDWAVGGQGRDLLFGEAGVDIVHGSMGDDTLSGGTERDIMRGGQDNDTMSGGDGNDFLSGDRGSDTISGGAGADTFHIFAGAGLDRVLDFTSAQGDRVMFETPGTAYTLVFQGGDTIVDLGGGTQMVLVGVAQAALGDWLA